MPGVLVVGSSNTDLTLRVPALPAPGETRLGTTLTRSPGGKGANQAWAARRAGGDVAFVTAVGDDDFGRAALAHYRDAGIDVSCVRVVPGTPSGVALIFVADDGENAIGVAPGANALLAAKDIDVLPETLFRSHNVLLVSLEVDLATVAHACERARTSGLTIVLNPAPATSEARSLIKLADVVTPNLREAAVLAGDAGATDPQALAARLLEQGARAVVITLGAAGCLLAERVEDAVRYDSIEGLSVEPDPTDTVGAGDAFNGVLAVALARGRSLIEAAQRAVIAGTLTVCAPGAQPDVITEADIEEMHAATFGAE